MTMKVLMVFCGLALVSTVSFAAGEAFSVQCQQTDNRDERLVGSIEAGELASVVILNSAGSYQLPVFKASEQKDPAVVDYRFGGPNSISGLWVEKDILAGKPGKIVSWVDALGYSTVDYFCSR